MRPRLSPQLSADNYGDLFKIKWSRNSRTDKGVHSVCTVGLGRVGRGRGGVSIWSAVCVCVSICERQHASSVG